MEGHQLRERGHWLTLPIADWSHTSITPNTMFLDWFSFPRGAQDDLWGTGDICRILRLSPGCPFTLTFHSLLGVGSSAEETWDLKVSLSERVSRWGRDHHRLCLCGTPRLTRALILIPLQASVLSCPEPKSTSTSFLLTQQMYGIQHIRILTSPFTAQPGPRSWCCQSNSDLPRVLRGPGMTAGGQGQCQLPELTSGNMTTSGRWENRGICTAYSCVGHKVIVKVQGAGAIA